MKKLLYAMFTIMLICGTASAAEVTLGWGASEGATGYILYYNEFNKDVGNVTQAAIDVVPGVEYTIYATAYNGNGESGPSNTVTYTAPVYSPPDDILPAIIDISRPATIIINVQ